MQARLAATDLACRRGARLLFRGLSFDLGPGEALHVTGANGVGKSSLIRILAGLLRPFAGEVVRHGAVGLVDERLALDESVPLGVALGFWQRLDRAGPTLDHVGLGHLGEVPVRYLSTGQRKRAAIARLLGQRAPVWLLDEPLNGLDEEARRMAESLIAAHCESGGVCLVASHQPIVLPGAKTLTLADYAMPPLREGEA